jgi:hypothetical protein
MALKNVLTGARSRSRGWLPQLVNKFQCAFLQHFPIPAAASAARLRKRNWLPLSIFFLSINLGIPRVKMINPLVPHCYKCA